MLGKQKTTANLKSRGTEEGEGDRHPSGKETSRGGARARGPWQLDILLSAELPVIGLGSAADK